MCQYDESENSSLYCGVCLHFSHFMASTLCYVWHMDIDIGEDVAVIYILFSELIYVFVDQ